MSGASEEPKSPASGSSPRHDDPSEPDGGEKERSAGAPTAIREGAHAPQARILAAAALIVITILVYLPAMRGGFIWDDREMAIDSPIVKSPTGLYDIWFTQKLPEYHPMSYSVFWAEWRLWGENPAGYHVVNILIHAVNVVLLWLVLRKLRIPGSWLAALLFGVHPVAVASAAWIAEIKNTLSMFFYLVAVL